MPANVPPAPRRPSTQLAAAEDRARDALTAPSGEQTRPVARISTQMEVLWTQPSTRRPVTGRAAAGQTR